MRTSSALAFSVVLAVASAAVASAPPPVRAFDQTEIAGRWFEIARTPTSMNKGCEGSTADWTPAAGKPNRFKISMTCRKGALDGPLKVMKGAVTILNPPQNNRVKMEMLGGLVSQEYWIIDRADDYGWLILGTPGGRYVSLMSRESKLPSHERASALGRVKELGYDTTKLAYPAQP